MEPYKFNFNNIQTRSFELDKTTSKMSISDVFTGYNSSINEYNLFLAHFNTIPNSMIVRNINCTKAGKWFKDYYSKEIKDYYYNNLSLYNRKNALYDDLFFILYEDLILDFDLYHNNVKLLFKKTDISKIETIIGELKKFKIKKGKLKPEISLVVYTIDGLDTKTLGITKPKLKIEDNYNDDFIEVHKTILKRLSKKNDKGLVLLLGKPGTGKTSYIRYLISYLKKNVIFLPPNLASVITSPDLIKLLIYNPNSVFVIEDAENIVVDREKDGSSSVSALLNISDGLLSDCLNIQIICSFNTDISRIDNALMRKGRLIAKYEFKELEADKAQMLANKLGYNAIINSPMTLTSIYNMNDNDFQQSRKSNPIGFKTISAN